MDAETERWINALRGEMADLRKEVKRLRIEAEERERQRIKYGFGFLVAVCGALLALVWERIKEKVWE